MKRYLVLFEKTEDGYSAYIPDLPGCVAAGSDLEETKKLIKEGMALHISAMEKDGDEIPEPSASYAELIPVEVAQHG